MRVPRRLTSSTSVGQPPAHVESEAQILKEESKVASRADRGAGQAAGDAAAGQKLEVESPIIHLYLTLETELPTQVNTSVDSENRAKPVPQCPDLRRFMSPLTWSPARKNFMLLLSCIATFLTAYSAGAYAPPAQLIANDLHTTREVTLIGITTFCLGFAVIPMALAPISELSGRYPVFVVSGLIYVVFQAACAFMPTITGMLFARFFVGAGGSVFSVVVGGVIADMWDKHERNTPMAFFSGAVLLGTAAGPLGSSALVTTVRNGTEAWRWTFWHQIVMDGMVWSAITIFFHESRASVLLSRKAHIVNKWYEDLESAGCFGVWLTSDFMVSQQAAQDMLPLVSDVLSTSEPAVPQTDESLNRRRLCRVRWLVKGEEQMPTLPALVLQSLRRPLQLLFTEPIVFCFSLWAAFSWAVLYLSFSLVPYLYGTDFALSSRIYIAMMAAAVIATVVGVLQERLLQLPQWRLSTAQPRQGKESRFWNFLRLRFPAEAPESRLYFACVTALLLPIGLFVAFFPPSCMDSYSRALGFGFATWGIYSVYLTTFNYLADSYHAYASSALAAQSACRNLLGGCFPVVVGPMFSQLGVKGAAGLIGGVAWALSVIPWVLVAYGATIRGKSNFAKSLQD